MVFCLNNHVLVIHYIELGIIQNTIIIIIMITNTLVHYLQDSEQSLLAIMGCTRGKKRNTHTMTTEERKETCQRIKK